MKYRSALSLIFFIMVYVLTSAAVYGEPLIKDRSDIVGSWFLELTAQKLDKTNSNEEESTWEFRPDGTVVISGYNKFLEQHTTFNKEYEVSEVAGKSVIKVTDKLGTTDYKVIRKEDDKMVLKGSFGYHFFKKK